MTSSKEILADDVRNTILVQRRALNNVERLLHCLNFVRKNFDAENEMESISELSELNFRSGIRQDGFDCSKPTRKDKTQPYDKSFLASSISELMPR